MAEAVDPRGNRTLGVLTKPDLVDKGAETAVIGLLEGKRHLVLLGWNVAKNLAQAKVFTSHAERLAAKGGVFSRIAPWSSQDKDKVGIASLRVRLQHILADHIRREFPKVAGVFLLMCWEMKLTQRLPGQSRDQQKAQGPQGFLDKPRSQSRDSF